MEHWSAIDIINQVEGELGLPPTQALPSADAQSNQLLALLNACGNELPLFYTWENLQRTWEFTTVPDQGEYDLPASWCYFVDQTQWDTTNRWPLLGPKSPQEWAWLKSGIVAAAPRMRYRVMNNKFMLHPVPKAEYTIRMEYMSCEWARNGTQGKARVSAGGDVVCLPAWLMVKFIKLKFYELKGFDTTHVRIDFTRTLALMLGKDKGAPKLSLSPRFPPIFIGPASLPDGSWDVGTGVTP